MKLPLALLCAALLLPLALPAGSAQLPSAGPAGPGAPGDPVRVLEDKTGDVKLGVAGLDQDPAGRFAAADLKALDVTEGVDQVTFTLTVASLSTSPSVPLAEDTVYTIGFRHLDAVYRLTLQWGSFASTASAYGYLEAYSPGDGRYQQVGPYQGATLDAAAGTLAFTVDRDLLVDRSGDAPHPEVPLSDWHAASTGVLSHDLRFGNVCFTRANCLPNPFPDAHDAMPDQGNGTTLLYPRFGVAQSGLARLYSKVPTRASNGEATTFVYQVEAVNRAPEEQTFALTASGVPAGWNVRLPAARLTIPANGSVELPVLASIPFAHQHGAFQKFLLEMQSLSDSGSTGRIQLGVRFTNPPQPAGHHNTLWLHSHPAQGVTGNAQVDALLVGPSGLYMNALDTDPLDGQADEPGSGCGTDLVPPQMHFCWYVPLNPQLELGLDFDLQRTGALSVPVKTTIPLQGAVLRGSLTYVSPSDGDRGFHDLVVANVVPRAAVDVAPNSANTFLGADIVPTQDGDYVPYQKGAQLYLDLELDATGAEFVSFGNDLVAPAIQPGGTLTNLPLNEYHDLVTQVFSSNSTLQLLADGPQDRATNPGKTLVYNLTLQNTGDAGLFNLELNGTHLSWARILAPGDQVRLPAGGSVPVRVAVQVPTTADKGDTADLVLSATSATNLNVRSLARLFATVATDRQYADESPLLRQAAAHHKTPGLEAALVPCLVALAALARRRRA